MIATEGRMIKKAISNSEGFASLSPKAAVLFCITIPHLNSHGKCNGGSGFIKDEICPLIPYLTLRNIDQLYAEITAKTNLKRFENGGRKWLHSLHFLKNHQKLEKSKLGKDTLPSYVLPSEKDVYSRVTLELPKSSPELLGHEDKISKEKIRQVGSKTETAKTAPSPVGDSFKNKDMILRAAAGSVKGME